MGTEYRDPRFNLGVVVQETGILPDTLRSWERRYRLPNPERTSGGQRLYSRYDIELLKWLLKKINEGMRIRQAVEQWRQLEMQGQDPLAIQFPQTSERDDLSLQDLKSPLQAIAGLPEEFVLPRYSGHSIVNIPSTICDWLGVTRLGLPPLSPDCLQDFKQNYQHVILLVMDGLGWNMLQRMTQEHSSASQAYSSIWRDILQDSLMAPITSVVPSTTTAALTALWTGLSPAETGMVGYELWLKEFSLIANMITQAPASFVGGQGSLESAGFKPTTFIPGPAMGTHLSANGIDSFAFIPQVIAHSGFSRMQMQGSKIMPYASTSDLWVTLRHLLQSRPRHRTYANVYWGTLDTLAHRYGPNDERLELEFAAFGMVLKDFILSLRQKKSSNTLLLMTADHGLIHTPRLPVYDLKNYPALLDCMVLQPTGENRLSYIYLRNGMEATFLRLIKEIWGDAFFLARSRELAEAGLFGTGPQEPHFANRLGDWVLASRGNGYCWWQEKENLMLGRHGGLSQDEMLVPLAGIVY